LWSGTKLPIILVLTSRKPAALNAAGAPANLDKTQKIFIIKSGDLMVMIISGILPEERDDLEKYGQIIHETERIARFVLRSKSKRLGQKHQKNKIKRRRRRGGR
jgi:hypothetical protein